MQDWLQYAVGGADLIVGTSAGSVLAGALRCGATVEELAAFQRGDAVGIMGESALAAQDGLLPPLPRLRFGSVPQAPLADAVVASCSIPGWYQPMTIGGCRYVDGGSGR